MKVPSAEKTGIISKRQSWYTYITVEPSMFFYMMAYMITSVIEQTFYIFQTCRINHGYSAEICYNLSSYPDINEEVQATVSIFHQWNGIASNAVPFILAFFIGAYSDKRGRKSILLAGLIGKLLFSAMITVNTLHDWPVEYVIYTATFPSALTGADLAIFAGCFAYIADVSTTASRTFRVGILDATYLSTLPTGVAIGKVLYNNVFNKSFTAMFAINTVFMILATLHCLFFLKWQTRPEQLSLRDARVTNPVMDFFDINHVKKTLITLTKKRTNSRRLFLWFLLIAMALYTFQRDERPTMYLYTIKVFQWDLTQFSNFRTYLSTAYVFLMLFGIPLMTKVLHWRDTVIIMLGASSHMCGHLIYAQTADDKFMYVGATAAALGPCVAPLIRSMASKLLPPSERGVAYTFLSVMENAVAIFAAVIYSQLYYATMNTTPSAIFYLTLSTQAVVFILAFIIEIIQKGKNVEAIVDVDVGETTIARNI